VEAGGTPPGVEPAYYALHPAEALLPGGTDWRTLLAPGAGARAGLGLWSSVPATLAVEGALFVAGLGLYLATTRARNRKGTIGLWAFVAFLLLGYLGSLGQVPPGVTVVAVTGLAASAISIPWIWWFDRNREAVRGDLGTGPGPAGAG
jgi:hypothetical protein